MDGPLPTTDTIAPRVQSIMNRPTRKQNAAQLIATKMPPTVDKDLPDNNGEQSARARKRLRRNLASDNLTALPSSSHTSALTNRKSHNFIPASLSQNTSRVRVHHVDMEYLAELTAQKTVRLNIASRRIQNVTAAKRLIDSQNNECICSPPPPPVITNYQLNQLIRRIPSRCIAVDNWTAAVTNPRCPIILYLFHNSTKKSLPLIYTRALSGTLRYLKLQ